MSDNIKVIEFESVKKGKNILFISLIGVMAVLAVVFLLLWVLKPAGVEPGSVREVEFTNSTAGGQTLGEDIVDGKKTYIASAGRKYSFSAMLVGDGGVSLVDWDISPAHLISGFSVSADPQNSAMVLCEFIAGNEAGQVTITAKTKDKVIGEFSFEIRQQFVETLTISSIKNAVTNASFPIVESDGRSVKLPYFSEAARSKYNVVSIDTLIGAKFDLSDYKIGGKNVNALAYNLICADGSVRFTEAGPTGTHVQIELVKTGNARLQIRANQNNAWAESKDCLIELAIQSVPLSDASMQSILSEISLKSGVARADASDTVPTIELFLHESNFYLHYNSAFEDRNNLVLHPAVNGFALKVPREVYADGRDRLENDLLLNTGNLGEYRLNPLKAGETYLLIEDSDSGYGARLLVRVLIFRPVTQVVDDANSSTSKIEAVCQASDEEITTRVRYTLDNRSDLNVPLTQQVKSTLFFYYPNEGLQPDVVDGAYGITDKSAYLHTAILIGMKDTGYVNPETGLRLFSYEPSLSRPAQNMIADLTFATGDEIHPGEILFAFFVIDQYRTTRPAPDSVKFSVNLTVMQTVQGLRFNFENFNRLIAVQEEGTLFYALDSAGVPVWEASDSDTFHTTAVLVRNVGANNAAARFNVFDLLRYYDAAGQEYWTRQTEFLPTETIGGITIERNTASFGAAGWPVNLSTSGDYGRFVGRVEAFTGYAEYDITATPSIVSETPEGVSTKLTLRVLYRDEIQSLTLTEQSTRTVPYLFHSAAKPALGNVVSDGLRIAYRQAATTTLVDAATFPSLYLNIFVRHNGEARMLYRYPQSASSPASATYRYYDYDYQSAQEEPNPADALFTRASSGVVTINRDLYMYSYGQLMDGKSAFDEFELVYSIEQLYNGETASTRHVPRILTEQAVRGYSVDKILEISKAARAKYCALRLFDEVGFFNAADERLVSTSSSRIAVMSEYAERIYASGVIQGLNVSKAEAQYPHLASLYKDSLGAITKSGAVEDGSGADEYRFVTESAQEADTASLSVRSVRGQIEGTAYFSVQFKSPMPIKEIQVFADKQHTSELTSASDAIRLAKENSMMPGKHTRQLFLRVTYDGSSYGTGLDKVDYETFDAVVFKSTGSGSSVVQVAYADECDYLMKMIPSASGFEDTEIAGTDYVRNYEITLTAATNVSERTQTYCVVPKHPVSDAAQAVQSGEFAVRVTAYAEYIGVQSQAGASISDLTLVMKDQSTSSPVTVLVKQFVGSTVPLVGLTENSQYTYKVLVPDGSGDYIEDDSLVSITQTVKGSFTVQAQGKVMVGAKIRFTLTYRETDGSVDTFADALSTEINLSIVAEVFNLSLNTAHLDPDGLYTDRLPITVYGSSASETYATGQANLIFNGGNPLYAPTNARFEISYTVKRDGVTVTSYPFELFLTGKSALGYRARNDMGNTNLNGYQVVITITNMGNATPFVAQFGLAFETHDFTLAFEAVHLKDDAQKSFVIVTDGVGQSTSLFTEQNDEVRFVAIARNAWTGAPLAGTALGAIGNIGYTENGTGASFAVGGNLLKITSTDTERFTVTATATAEGGAGQRTAQIAVSKFNRIKEFKLVSSAQMPKPVMTESAAGGVDFTLTMVKSAIGNSSVNLMQYLQAVGEKPSGGEVAPFTGEFTAAISSGNAIGLNGRTLTTVSAGVSDITITANRFTQNGYTDPVTAATAVIRVTVLEISASITAQPTGLNFGVSDSFSFEFKISQADGTPLNVSGHDVSFALTETTSYIGSLSGSVSGNTYTATIESLKKNITAGTSLGFSFACTVDGVTVTAPVTCAVTLLTGNPDFTLTHANGSALDTQGGVYQLDYQIDQTAKIAFDSGIAAQIAALQAVSGLNVSYAFSSSDNNILRVNSGASSANPLFTVVGEQNFGTVTVTLTLTVSGSVFTKSIQVDVFSSAKIQAKVFAGGTLTLQSGSLYTLSGNTEIASGGTLVVDYGAAQTGIQSATKIYLAAAYDASALSLDESKFTMFVNSNSLRATGTKGFINDSGNIRYYFVEYEVASVSNPSTDVLLRTTALIGNYYYTSDATVALTATAPILDYKAASTGAISTVPGSTHDVAPILSNLASVAGTANKFYGTYRTVYEWISYDIAAGALEIVNGQLVVAPRIAAGTATLKITVVIESGAFAAWTDNSLSKTVTVTVASAGAPTFALKQGATIILERAETGNRITADLFANYINLTIPNDYDDPAYYTLTAEAVEIGYGDAGSDEISELTTTPRADHTFDLSLPNRVFYLKLSVTLAFGGGQWKGYSEALTLSFFVSPLEPEFTLSGGAREISNAYHEAGQDVSVTGVTAGDTVSMSATVEEILRTDSRYTGHYQIGYTVSLGKESTQSHTAAGIGYIDGNNFITDVRGTGGVVYLHVVIKFINGPFKGHEYSFAEEVFVLSLRAASNTIATGADYAVTDSGVYIRSGKSVNLKSVLEKTSNAEFERMPQEPYNTPASMTSGLSGEALIDAGYEKPGYLHDASSLISVDSGALYRTSGATEDTYLNLGPILTLTLRVTRDGVAEPYVFRRTVNLYIMSEALPTASVTAVQYYVANSASSQTNATGTASVYAGDQIAYTVSAQGVPIQKVDLYFKLGAAAEFKAASVSSLTHDGAYNYTVLYTVPASLTAGTYTARVELTVAGQICATAAGSFVMQSPQAVGASYSITRSESQLFNGSNSTLTVTKTGGANITRVRFTFPTALSLLGSESVFTAVESNGIYTVDYTFGSAVNLASLTLQSTQNITASVDIAVTVFTHTATNLSGAYRYEGSASVQLLADLEMVGLIQPKAPATRYYAQMSQTAELHWTDTRLNYANMDNPVYSVAKGTGELTDNSARVALENVAGVYPSGYVRLNVTTALNARFAVNVTLVSYEVGGKTITVNSTVTVEFVPAPQFTVTNDDINTFTVASSNANIEITDYEIISGVKHVVGGVASIDNSSASPTLSFLPHYYAGADNKAVFRIVVKVTDTSGPYAGVQFVLNRADYMDLEFTIDNPYESFAVTESGRTGLKLSGTLAVENAVGGTPYYSIASTDQTKFNGTYPQGTSGSFVFNQSKVDITVPVTVEVRSSAIYYTAIHPLTNFAVPTPTFTTTAQSGNTFTVSSTDVAFELVSASVAAGDAKSASVSGSTVTFVPNYNDRGANRAVVSVLLRVTSGIYATDTFTVLKEVEVFSVLTGSGTITETDTNRESAGTIAGKLSGGFTVPVPTDAEVSFATDNWQNYFTSFDEETGVFVFKQSAARQTRTVTITVDYNGGTFVYHYDLINYEIAAPVFTLTQDVSNPYIFTVSGTVGGVDYDMTEASVEVVRTILSGSGFSGGFSSIAYTDKKATFTLLPNYIANSGTNEVKFSVVIRINQSGSAYDDQAFTAQFKPQGGSAQNFATVEVTDRFNIGSDAVIEWRGAGSIEAMHTGTLTVPIASADRAEVASVTFTPDNAGLFNSGFTSWNYDTTGAKTSFVFKPSAADVSSTVAIRIVMENNGGCYNYTVTLHNAALPTPSFRFEKDTDSYLLKLSGVFEEIGAEGADVPIDMETVSAVFTCISGGEYVHSSTNLTATVSQSAAETVYRLIPQFIKGGHNKVEYRITFILSGASFAYPNQSFSITTGEIDIEDLYEGKITFDMGASRTDAFGLIGTIAVNGLENGEAVTYEISSADQGLFATDNYPGSVTNPAEFEFQQSATEQTVWVKITVDSGEAGLYIYYKPLVNHAIAAPVFTAEVCGDEIWVSGTMACVDIDMEKVDVSLNILSGSPFVIANSVQTDDDKSDSSYTVFTFAKNFTQGMTGQSVRFEAECSFKAESEYAHKGRTFTALADSAIAVESILGQGEAITDTRDDDTAEGELSGTIVLPNVASSTVAVSVADTSAFKVDSYPGLSDEGKDPLEFTFRKNTTSSRIAVVVTVVWTLADGSTYTYYHTLYNDPYPTPSFSYEITSDTVTGGALRLTAEHVDEGFDYQTAFAFIYSDARLSFGAVGADGVVTFTKHPSTQGGMVTVTVVMTYDDGGQPKTKEQDIQIYVMPASPQIDVGVEKFDSGTFKIEAALVTALGGGGETFALTNATATVISGQDLITCFSSSIDNTDNKLVLSYQKVDTLEGGTAQVLMMLCTGGIEYYKLIAITVDAMVSSGDLRVTQASAVDRSFTYQVEQSTGGDNGWAAFALPQGWSIVYGYVGGENNAHVEVAFDGDAGSLSYVYKTLLSDAVFFTVTATVTDSRGKQTGLSFDDGEIPSWDYSAPPITAINGTTAEDGGGDIPNIEVKFDCASWTFASYLPNEWYQSVLTVDSATRDDAGVTVNIANLSDSGTFTIAYGDIGGDNYPAILTVTVDLGEAFAENVRRVTVSFQVVCESEEGATLITVTMLPESETGGDESGAD